MIRASVLPGPGQSIEVREIPEPALEPNSALLAVEYSEVCGTDVHLQDGKLSGVPYPIIPGHVSAGRLAKVRGDLHDVEGRKLREGDRVTFLDVHGSCNACWYCLVAHASTRCPQRRVYGITYGLADGATGGWADKLYLKPQTRIIPLGDVDAQTFMHGGCALPTSLHAMQRAPLQLTDSVLVLGSGPVGLTLVILARLRGAGSVLCIGAPNSRLHAAKQAGATATLDFTQHSTAEQQEWVRQHTAGRGADITFEASGDPNAVAQAMRCSRDAGTVIVVGQYTDRGEVQFNPHADLNRKHLDVRGCWGSDYSHFARAVQLMGQPDAAAAFQSITMQRFGLGELNEALAAVRDGSIVKALVDPST
jgi:threonine dehydrogenase-like Zn-dependent dehydrogenase